MKQERLITRKEERQVCNRCGKDITNEEHYTFLLNYSYKWFEKADGKPTVVQSDFAPDYCVDCARAFSAEFRHLNLEFNTYGNPNWIKKEQPQAKKEQPKAAPKPEKEALDLNAFKREILKVVKGSAVEAKALRTIVLKNLGFTDEGTPAANRYFIKARAELRKEGEIQFFRPEFARKKSRIEKGTKVTSYWIIPEKKPGQKLMEIRAEQIYQMRLGGATFREIGAKYQITANRAAQIFYKAARQHEKEENK